MKYLFGFNPLVNDAVVATVTNQSNKSVVYFMSGSMSMEMASKPSVKSIKVSERFSANGGESITAYNNFVKLSKKEKK